MDPVTQIDFIRSREMNVPYEGFKGAVKELYQEGPLTILFAAGVGAVIGALALVGAPILTGSSLLTGTSMGVLSFMTVSAAASAMLTTVFVAARGYLEGRHDALEKNTLLDHMADLHKNEVALQGLAVKKELDTELAKREGTAPRFLKDIISNGQRSSPATHAEQVLAMRAEMNNAEHNL